jgi:hypothetical protein
LFGHIARFDAMLGDIRGREADGLCRGALQGGSFSDLQATRMKGQTASSWISTPELGAPSKSGRESVLTQKKLPASDEEGWRAQRRGG